MSKQNFDTVDVLRLEIEDEPTGLTNLVQNPSGELGGWAWVTPIAGSALAGGDALTYTGSSAAANAEYFYTEAMPITATHYAAASWYVVGGSTGDYYRVKFEWLDASEALLSSSTQTSYLSATSVGTVYYGPYQAPASTVYVRIRFDLYDNNTGTNPGASNTFSVKEVTVAKHSVSASLGTLRTNLVPNPSFEQTTWGWEADTEATIAQTAAQAHTGTKSLAVTSTGSGSDWSRAQSELISITGGATYTVSGYVRAATVERLAAVYLRWYNSDKNGLSTTVSYVSANATTSAFGRRTATLTAPSNAAYAQVVLAVFAQNVGEVFYWDAVQLEKALEATDYFDGTSSGGGVTYATTTQVRTNLILNPSMETNANRWFSNTDWNGATLSRSTSQSRVGSASLLYEALSGSKYASVRTADGASGRPVTPGVRYSLKFSIRLGTSYTSNNWIGARVAFYTAAGAYINNGYSESTVFALRRDVSTGTWYDLELTSGMVAPATAAFARVNIVTTRDDGSNLPAGTDCYLDKIALFPDDGVNDYFDGDTTDLTGFTYAWTGTSHDSTSTLTGPLNHTALTSNLAYIEPVQYVNVLGPTHEIQVNRAALNVGTLTATILDATIDPANDTLIRPGKKVRLLAYDTDYDEWYALFTGKASTASVTYDLKDPGIPEQKRARIELVAVDANSELANQSRPQGVAAIADLPYVLEGCGVPWFCEGPGGNQVSSATIVSTNESASALDQIALTADSVHGYAWVDRNGVIQVLSDADYTSNAFPEEESVTEFDIGYNTQDCINEVMVTYLRYNATTLETEEIVYGPYRDESSISEWGVRSAEFTVHGISEASISTFASAVLTENATPVVRINGLTGVFKEEWLLSQDYLFIDLGQYVFAEKATVGTEPYAYADAVVTSIEHSITPEKWTVSYGFRQSGSVAAPTMQPPVQLATEVYDTGWVTVTMGNGGAPFGGAVTYNQYRRIGQIVHYRSKRVTNASYTPSAADGDFTNVTVNGNALPAAVRPSTSVNLSTRFGDTPWMAVMDVNGNLVSVGGPPGGKGTIASGTSFETYGCWALG